MRANEIISEGLSHKNARKIIKKFILFAKQHLDLTEIPEIDLIIDNEQSMQNKSFGGYGDRHITLTIANRHINDCLRTLAHELVHFKQDLNGELEDEGAGTTGSPQENEANAQAAVIMRKWGQKHPTLFKMKAID